MFFEKLSLQHKKLINKYCTINSDILCDYSFNDLFFWRDYYNTMICEKNNTLFIKYIINGEDSFCLPLGNTEYGINQLIDYTREHNKKLRINSILENKLNFIPPSFRIAHLRGNDDYIYFTSELASLAGKKFKAKRNQVNSFQAKYNYSVKEIENSSEVRDFIQKFALDFEVNPMLEALDNKDILNIIGLALYVDNKIVAVTMGSIHNDTLISHFEKANNEYSGVYQMINYLMANYVLDKTIYINREEDLGIEGLRKAKLSYNPVKLVSSYSAFYNCDYNIEISNPTNEERNYLIALWENIFKDGNFSKLYLNDYYDTNNTYVVRVNNKIVTMAIIMTYGGYNYLYALSTHPDYRGLGFAKLLINYLSNKYNNLFLIAGAKQLIEFYSKLGFNQLISSYSATIKLNTNDIVSVFEPSYDLLYTIYNSQSFDKLPRTINDFKKIIDLYNCKMIATNDSYALYRIDNNELIIYELIGDIRLANSIMSIEGFDSCIVVSPNLGEPKYILAYFDKYIYANMLFD